ncbi:MAG: HAD-IB family phosphatase [Acidobacteriia bacterium]|nr:HAD-IB family phosphatase [Terriglobia bacterium]
MSFSAQNRNARIAAFFDLDGTLLGEPSLEWHFFRHLRERRLLGMEQYFGWVAETLRLARRGISAAREGNKMYLRGVTVEAARSFRPARWEFFAEGLLRLRWHAAQGHRLVLVSGTLEPLAQLAGRALEAELARRGCVTPLRVCATRLEETEGCWSGRMPQGLMNGEAKAEAVRRIAAEEGFDLELSFASGNSAGDLCMLGAVGRPAAVNPDATLAQLAARAGWPVLQWGREEAGRKTEKARRAALESVFANSGGERKP